MLPHVLDVRKHVPPALLAHDQGRMTHCTSVAAPLIEGASPLFVRRLIIFLFLAAPALWTGTLIFRYGVDTPWADQWDGTWPLFEKMEAGTLGFRDFFAFYCEHRIVFPRLISFGLARLTHWNIRAELLIIWLLSCVCAFNIWRVAQATGWGGRRNCLWLLLAANVLLFSPLQWENFLYGFQIGYLLPLACTTACCWVAPTLRAPFNFIGTLALCLVCTFSIASGFTSWLLTAPLLLLTNKKSLGRGRKVCWSLWFSVAAASTCLYFYGYQAPPGHPVAAGILQHPLAALQFWLVYIGAPFSGGLTLDSLLVSQIAGLTLVSALIACLFYLWRWRRDQTLLADSLPWLALSLVTLGNGFLVTLGRFSLGIHLATQSRYISFAIMLPIALLFLVPRLLRHRWETSASSTATRSASIILAALGGALSVLLLCGTMKSLEIWGPFQHVRLTGKAELLLSNVVDEPAELAHYVHWTGAAVRSRVNLLDRIGFVHPPLVRSRQIRKIAFGSVPGGNGAIKEFTRDPTGECQLIGWATLPEKDRVADAVVLTYDNPAGDSIIFALAEVRSPRPGVHKAVTDQAESRSGWTKSWKAEQVPGGVRLIRAWAFDAEDCRAYQIGAASLEPAPPSAP